MCWSLQQMLAATTSRMTPWSHFLPSGLAAVDRRDSVPRPGQAPCTGVHDCPPSRHPLHERWPLAPERLAHAAVCPCPESPGSFTGLEPRTYGPPNRRHAVTIRLQATVASRPDLAQPCGERRGAGSEAQAPPCAPSSTAGRSRPRSSGSCFRSCGARRRVRPRPRPGGLCSASRSATCNARELLDQLRRRRTCLSFSSSVYFTTSPANRVADRPLGRTSARNSLGFSTRIGNSSRHASRCSSRLMSTLWVAAASAANLRSSGLGSRGTAYSRVRPDAPIPA